MKSETYSTSATVKDFSLVDATNENGPRKDGSLEVDVPYTVEHKVLENETEFNSEFSVSQRIAMGNARLKATANASARATAVAPYAQDPNSVEATRERMIKDAIKAKPGLSREKAEAFVDSLLNS